MSSHWLLQQLLTHVSPALQQLRQTDMSSLMPPGVITGTKPLSDPYLYGTGNLNFSTGCRFVLGVVTDTTAYFNCYRVQLDQFAAPRVCTLLAQTAASAMGVRDARTIQPGAGVLVMLHNSSPQGWIVGVLPPAKVGKTLLLSDQLSQAMRTRADESHRRPAQLQSGVVDYLAGRPIDQLTGGEWAQFSATGLRLMLDDYMLQAAVDETAGLFAFYHNRLVRLNGYNYEHQTAGHLRHAYDDQGEYSEVSGWTPYPWEQLGKLSPGNPFTDNAADAWQRGQPVAAKEPENQNQWPFHRTREYRGYLGQGYRQLVVAPPANTDNNLLTPGQPAEIGLFSEHIGTDGRLHIATARGLSLTKTMAIVVPRQQRRQQDPQGDTAENYKFADQYGGGAAHKAPSLISTTDEEQPAEQRLGGLLDLHAFLTNYSSLQAFLAHEKDWDCAESSDLPHIPGPLAATPDFGQLRNSARLPEPDAVQLKIDHREGMVDVKYFLSTCGLELLEDGSVSLTDGYGSQLAGAGGTLDLNAPGDINIRAGRNIVLWAGKDVLIRAKNSIEAATTDSNIYLKSERGLHVLAGNSGSGGILLESRGTGNFDVAGKAGEDVVVGGIAIRATAGDIGLYGNAAYLRGEQTVLIDAGQGRGNVLVNSASTQIFATGTVGIGFGRSGNIRKVVEFSTSSAAIDAALFVGGTAIVDGALAVNGNVEVVNGHIATEKAEQAKYLVAPLKDDALRKVQDAITTTTDQIAQLRQSAGTVYTQTSTAFYAEGRPGNSETLNSLEFSFRTDTQRGLEDYNVLECRWQQLARAAGQSLAAWEERPVACQADPETYPFPGAAAFTTSGLLQQELSLYDARTGAGVARGDAYNTPEYGALRKAPLNQYQITG